MYIMKQQGTCSEAEGTWCSYLCPQISFSSLPPCGLMGCGGVHAISSTLPGHCCQGEGGIGQGCASNCSPGPALCVFTGLASEVEVFAEGRRAHQEHSPLPTWRAMTTLG